MNSASSATVTEGWHNGTIVVTGAAGGIGRAIVADLLERGYGVVGVDLARDVESLGGRAMGVRADLTSEQGRASVVDAVATLAPGTLVGLVNGAGITRDGLLKNLDDQQIALVLEVNAVAAAELSAVLAPRLADGGAIVNIASRAALGNIGQVNYSASKGAIIGLTRASAHRLAPRIRVNAVSPGLIDTEMTAAMPEKVLNKLIAQTPLKRMAEPYEVAEQVAFLLGPESRYVTGQVVYICGGRSV
jgi:3-oxoacyl-[acyl-carrier protein] reductase